MGWIRWRKILKGWTSRTSFPITKGTTDSYFDFLYSKIKFEINVIVFFITGEYTLAEGLGYVITALGDDNDVLKLGKAV